MKKLDDNASIVPVVVALGCIFLGGLLMSIFGAFMLPLMNSDNNINDLFSKLWVVAVPMAVLIVMVFYAIVSGQRGARNI